MKVKLFIISLFIWIALVMVSVNISGCAAGGNIGPVGGSAHIG